MLSIGMKIEKRENKPKNTILKERGLGFPWAYHVECNNKLRKCLKMHSEQRPYKQRHGILEQGSPDKLLLHHGFASILCGPHTLGKQ